MGWVGAKADHSWRAGRALRALDPTHFLIDERSEAELIAYTSALASQLRFDEGNDESGGSFADLLERDVTFLLAEISIVDGASEYERVSRQPVDQQCLKVREDTCRLRDWINWLTEASAELSTEVHVDELLSHCYFIAEHELAGLLIDGKGIAHTDPAVNGTEGTFSVPFDIELFARIENQLMAADTLDESVPMIYSAVNRVTQSIVTAARVQLEHVLAVRHDHPPHVGLYLAFVRLMRERQAHLNGFTERHLNHFYKQHLGLRPRAAKPDTAHVWFEAVPHGAAQVIPRNSTLSAGVAPDGRTIEYATADDVYLSRARVAHIRSLHIQRAPCGTVQAIQQADRLETISPPTQARENSGGWRPFGPWCQGGPIPFADAELGLLVCSPILVLSDGSRQVKISLEVDNPAALNSVKDQLASSMFRHSVSVADGFYDVAGVVSTTQTALVFTLDLDVHVPPLCVSDGTSYQWPLWRMKLVPSRALFAYSALCDLELVNVLIEVEVDDMRAVHVRNPEGPVDISKPFAPFGGVPVPGSSLTITAPEWRDRDLTHLAITADWANLPPGGFLDYFNGYRTVIRNESYTASLSQLVDNKWHRVEPLPESPPPDRGLFQLFTDARSSEQTSETELQLAASARYGFKPHPGSLRQPVGQRQPLAIRRPLAIDTEGNVFRLTLEEPIAAFGHALYPKRVAESSLAVAKEASKGPISKGVEEGLKLLKTPLAPAKKVLSIASAEPDEQLVPLNAPLTPMLKDIRVGYSAQTRIGFTDSHPNGEVYRLESYGRVRPVTKKRPLLEQLKADGYLYIGVTGLDLHTHHPLTLLIHVNDKVATRSVFGGRGLSGALHWSYLSQDGWQRFPADGIRADNTQGLIRSGIVTLMPQPGMAEDTDSPGVLWICAATDCDTSGMGAVVSIHTHGVSAQRISKIDPVADSWILPAGSIKRMMAKHIQVASIEQPFDSQHGRGPESESEFRVRVSERLRHKNRAVQPLDYEQLTLEKFPTIGDAKCLVTLDGGIILVVAPVRNDFNTRPGLSAGTLSDVAAYLRPLLPATVGRLNVRNPGYDTVRISAWIDADDSELDALLVDLAAAADRAIAPWLFNTTAPLAIGSAASQVDVAQVQRALTGVPRVRTVSGVSLVTFSVVEAGPFSTALHYQLHDTAAVADLGNSRGDRSAHESIRASTPWSVLTPVRTHRFRLLNTPLVGAAVVSQDMRVMSLEEVQDPERLRRIDHLERAGIGNLAVGSELVICHDSAQVSGARRRFAVQQE